VAAVQFKVVPVMVVPEAATPVGALGAAAQDPPPPPPPPPLELPPQEGNRNKPVITIPRIRKPSSFLRCEGDVLKPIPNSESPATGSHIA